MGQLANEVRAALESAIEEQGKRLEAKALEERLAAEAVDVTIPGKAPKLGHKHPIYLAPGRAEGHLHRHGLHGPGRPRGGAGRVQL